MQEGLIEGGLFGVIRDLYPVSTIMIILTFVGIFLAMIECMPIINDLRKLLKIRPVKDSEK